MSGKVIQTLRSSPLAPFLTEAELRMLAGCGQVHEYAAGQDIVSADGQDERLFLLREGKVDLYLAILTDTRMCSGDAHVELSAAGDPFGWAAWMRSDRWAFPPARWKQHLWLFLTCGIWETAKSFAR